MLDTLKRKLEDSQVVIRIRKSKKDIQQYIRNR